jgi:hypothetical protein
MDRNKWLDDQRLLSGDEIARGKVLAFSMEYMLLHTESDLGASWNTLASRNCVIRFVNRSRPIRLARIG